MAMLAKGSQFDSELRTFSFFLQTPQTFISTLSVPVILSVFQWEAQIKEIIMLWYAMMTSSKISETCALGLGHSIMNILFPGWEPKAM